MQRIFDYLLALALLLPALVLCSFAAIAIWFECRANPIFLQKRAGLKQRSFTLYKLRTMHPNTKNAASHEVSQSQILRSGHFLRATKLDELPQILNVLNGTMSFVGPRPCLPSQTELLSERTSRGVMNVLPGITGPSQLAGIDMSDPVKLAVSDAHFVANQSTALYLRCLIQTFLGRGSGDAARK